MSDLELFKALGGDDDAIVTKTEFVMSMHDHPKLRPFGASLKIEELDLLFYRFCGNFKGDSVEYDKYKMLLQ